MSEGWDDYAEGWDSNEDVIAYSEKAFKSLLDTVNLNGLRILDFGCGTGLLTEKISPLAKELVALDPSEKMISILSDKKLPNVTTVSEQLSESLITESKLFAEKFDLIVASSVCGFLPEYEKTLALLKRLLVPGGTFVQWDWQATEGNHDFGLSREKIVSTYTKVGLKLEALEQVFSLDGTEANMPVLMGIARNA
jgi:predicted TPR repeat methyltransferase